MKKLQLLFCLLVLNITLHAQSLKDSVQVTTIQQQVDLKDFEIRSESGAFVVYSNNLQGNASIQLNGESKPLSFTNGKATLKVETDKKGGLFYAESANTNKLYHLSKKENSRSKHIPLWLSLLPPLIAIVFALIFKEVTVSLFLGIWSGAFIAGGMRWTSFFYWIESIWKVVSEYVTSSLQDSGHISVIVFSLLIGGLVAIISKNGGMAGVVASLSKYAQTARSTQFVTWILGIAIFFDDYANTLIVGNTMRSATDKFRISREKLAYIVDSTAAPVSAIAFITTWIGAELGYIGDGMAKIEMANSMTPYAIFLQSLKYAFYPVLTLFFILVIIYTRKDYGAMFKAELRARSTGQVSPARTSDEDEPDMEDLSPVKNAPNKWQYAVIPILTVIFVTIYGLLHTGFESINDSLRAANEGALYGWGYTWDNMASLAGDGSSGFFNKLGNLIGASDSYVALLWSSLSGVIVALAMTVFGRIMSLFDTMHWMVTGFKTMLPAIIILTLAWALAITTDQLHTADFLSSALQDNIHPYAVPALIFVLSAGIAFSTGSSWSTMAILYPIAIPTTWAICNAYGLSPDASFEILLCSISTVLAASVLGDHCSPISDTTILSSLATDCNHIDHVKTQLPYALTVGIVSIIGITVSIILGGGWMVCLLILLLSMGILVLLVHKLGKKIPPEFENNLL